MAVGFDVFIEQHLLTGDIGVFVKHRRVPVVGAGDRASAVHTVLLALEAAGVVPPVPASARHREVGLLGARLDLVEDFLPQLFLVGGLLIDVAVLGLEVGDNLRVGLVAQPFVGVDEDVVVVDSPSVDTLGHWRVHALTPIQSSNWSPETRS